MLAALLIWVWWGIFAEGYAPLSLFMLASMALLHLQIKAKNSPKINLNKKIIKEIEDCVKLNNKIILSRDVLFGEYK